MTAVLDRAGPENDTSPGVSDPPSRSLRKRRGARPVRWSPFALTGLLITTAVLYLWNLSASGYANTFYAAAAWAGSESWKAWLFGALDPSNFITVDLSLIHI